MRPILAMAVAGIAVVCATGVSAQPAPRADKTANVDLAAVRAATERFQDIEVALAEGYIADPMNTCETAASQGQPAELGAMGVHYFRPDLLGITGPPNPRVNGTSTHTDFLNPAVLIYEPQEDGSQKLIAVENLVFIQAWEAAGNAAAPTFNDVAFDRMEDDAATAVDEAHMFEPHYDLHIWLYRDNPNGMFAQYNPNVTCEYHAPATATAHTH